MGTFTHYTKAQADLIFARISSAVALSTSPAAPPAASGSAGTAVTAARGDHVHRLSPIRPSVLGAKSGTKIPMSGANGSNSSSLNRGNFGPVWVSTYSRSALSVTAVSLLVTTPASAGGTIRFGMWAPKADGSIDFTNKIFETGEIASTSGGYANFSFAGTIPEGLYWAGQVMHGATCSTLTSNHGIISVSVDTIGDFYSIGYLDGLTGAFPTVATDLHGAGDISPLPYFTFA